MRRLLLPILSLITLAQVQAASYVVGVEALNYYPHYKGDKGEFTGFARALLDRFAEHAQIDITYKPLPIKRLFKTFLEGDQLDFKYPDHRFWQADLKEGKEVIYSDPVVEYIDGVHVLPDHLGRGAEQLGTFALPRGFTPYSYLDLIDRGIVKTKELDNNQTVVRVVLDGHVNGAFGNSVIIAQTLRDLGKDPQALVFDPDLPHTRSHYHLSTIRQPEVLVQFNTFMTEEAAAITALKNEYQVALPH